MNYVHYFNAKKTRTKTKKVNQKLVDFVLLYKFHYKPFLPNNSEKSYTIKNKVKVCKYLRLFCV